MDQLTKRKLSREERRYPKHLRPKFAYVSNHVAPITPDDIRMGYSQPNPMGSSLMHHTLGGQDEMMRKSHHKIHALSQMDERMLDANDEALINTYYPPKRKPGLLLKRKLMRLYGKNPGKLKRISGGGAGANVLRSGSTLAGLGAYPAYMAAAATPALAGAAPFILAGAAGLGAASFITDSVLRAKRAKHHRKQGRREMHNYIEHPEQYSDYQY